MQIKSAAKTSQNLPKPPEGMNTPNMRFAIACGLLAADNRLGTPDHKGFDYGFDPHDPGTWI